MSNGSLLHELAGFGLHAMQNGSLASDLGDWLGYNLATSYYQFEQWLANPANFQLALGAVIIGAAIAVTGGAAIPVILIGAALGGGIGYGAQVFQNYQQGYSHLDALWHQINLSGIGQAAFHGAVSGAAAALIGALLPGGGAGLVGALQTSLAEFVSGRAAQVALNMVSGQAWNQDLWNPLDIALDVIPGVTAGPLARVAGRTVSKGANPVVRNSFGTVTDVTGRVTRTAIAAVESIPGLASRGVDSIAETVKWTLKEARQRGGIVGSVAELISRQLKPIEPRNIRAWLRKDTPHLDALPYINAKRGPKRLGKGWEKEVFEVATAEGYEATKLVWLQQYWWGAPSYHEDELAILAELAELGLPVARNIGKIEVRNPLGIKQTIVLQERMVAEGSKDFLKLRHKGYVNHNR